MISWLCPIQRGKKRPKRGCLQYDVKLHLMVRLQFWNSREYRVTSSFLYSTLKLTLCLILLVTEKFGKFILCWWFLDYANCIPWREVWLPLPPPWKRGVLSETLNCFQWLGLKSTAQVNIESYFCCHYSQVHSNPEWLYLLGSHLWAK